MNMSVILELVELAVSLAHSQGDGTIQGDKDVAKALLGIVDAGVRAYQDHTGEPLNVDLIHPETAI